MQRNVFTGKSGLKDIYKKHYKGNLQNGLHITKIWIFTEITKLTLRNIYKTNFDMYRNCSPELVVTATKD